MDDPVRRAAIVSHVNSSNALNPRRRLILWMALSVVGLSLSVALPAWAADRANVPLKNWGGFSLYRDALYDDLERLVTAGMADGTILNTKPLNRTEAARVVVRAVRKIRADEVGSYNARRDLEPVLDRLLASLGPDIAALGEKVPGVGGPPPGLVTVTPVDRAQAFAGWASRHLSLENSQGRRFEHGVNGGVTWESRAQFGDLLSVYVQPEVLGNEADGAMRLASGYAKLTLANVELLVGRESIWWGPGLRGSLTLSNNAAPLDQIRLGVSEPFSIPWVSTATGPMKILGFLAQLEGRRDYGHAKLAGMRATVAPLTVLELGLSYLNTFDGDTRPRPGVSDYPRILFNPTSSDQRFSDPRFRNNIIMALDGDLRLPNVDRYVPLGRDARVYGEFGWDDTCCETAIIPNPGALSWLVGIHLLGLFGWQDVDGRFEYAQSQRESFTHDQFYRGHWTRGEVISHLMGTDGSDLWGRLTNRMLPELMVGVDLSRSSIGSTVSAFPGPHETRTGGGVDVSYSFWGGYSLFARYQAMRVRNRDFRSGDDGVDHLLRFELTRLFR